MLYDMNRVAIGEVDYGKWFSNILTLTSGTYSDIWLLPETPVLSIGLSVTGSGSWDFSISPPAILEAGSGIFSRWDGVAQVNPAVTGFRLIRDAGTVTGTVTVKTY
jgi:hypothetical protein